MMHMSMTTPRTAALIAAPLFIATLFLSTLAQASSDDAWAKFSADVEKACLKASASAIEKGRAVVDPYGSTKYGMAIVTGRPSGVPKTTRLKDISVICVYDKKTKAAEVGGEIEIGKVAATSPRQK